ncbi:MAG: cupin domain-containing protein [Rhodospirillaceae bacterium]
MNQRDLKESLGDLNLEPLWERTEGGLRPGPQPDAPQIWRWADIEPLIDETISAVPMEMVDRRVLTLRNPDPRRRVTTTTRSINCGIQILMPGETAPPHRHSPNALRVALEGSGGETTVNGKPYPMSRGDVILTPSWTSHAHAHRGHGRVVWIDFLDVPLYRDLDLIFFEIGDSPRPADAPTVGRVHDGVLPEGRFPWADVRADLQSRRGREDTGATFDYVDAAVGDAVFPTLDCRAHRLDADGPVSERRSSANSVCLAIEGEGESRIGDALLSWKPNDIFTVPHWCWHKHRATGAGAPAFLLEVSDRPALRRLGMLQENRRADTGR